MTDRINDIVAIFNALKSNEDFYIEILKDAFTANKIDEARKITRARDELKNGYTISQDTIELIKNNIDKYINVINKLKDKEKENENSFTTANDTYNINLEDEKDLNNDTFVFTNNNVSANNDANKDQENEEEKDQETVSENTVSGTSDNNIPEVGDIAMDDTDIVYSSNIAKMNLEQEIARVNSQIEAIRNNINNSEKMPSKKEYQQLFQLEAYRDRLQSKIENINLDESYGNNARVLNNDNRLNVINDKIKENKGKLASNKPKFVKVVLSRKLSKLQMQKGKIQERQRTIVNKDLLKYYNSSFKIAKSASKEDANNEYYKDKKELLQEKKGEILDNVNENDNSIINSVRNKFYKFKSMPTELRIKHIENLQQHNTLKDKVGKVVGFNKIKQEISNKLYPKARSAKKQAIENLRQLSGYFKNVQQQTYAPQYDPNMESMFDDLVPDQPMLESSVKQH